MNRLLLIPCVASCLGFVFLAGPFRTGEVRASGHSAAEAVVCSEGEVLLTSEQVQEELIDQWQRYNRDRYAFSRVFRPEQHYRSPGMWVNETLPAPEGSFVGVFTLEDSRHSLYSEIPAETPMGGISKVEYPIVANRRNGEAMIFASGKWVEFSQWAVTGN